MILKIFIRNLKRNRIISTINIFGLVIGILSSLFIIEYVYFEKSYDSYHSNADNLYRVVYKRFHNDKLLWNTANSYYPIGSWLEENYSEVVNSANLRRFYNITVGYKDAVGNKVTHYEPKAYYANSAMFELFDIPLIQGSVGCLNDPATVAISEKYARKYFGKSDPIGETLNVNDRENYTITGVYQDIPRNSHIQTDFMFSLKTVLDKYPSMNTVWGRGDLFHTYIQLKPGVNPDKFEKTAFPNMIDSNYKDFLARMEQHDEVYMQAVPSIHLNSDIDFEMEAPGSAANTNILYGFAILLLIVAWINYVNLVTAQSIERAKEIGVRKTSGAKQTSLVSQFIAEAFFFNLVCFILAFTMFLLINPLFMNLAKIEDFNLFTQVNFLKLLGIAFPLGIILSSIYPAFILSSFNPIKVLKGKFKNSNQAMVFRKSLVTIQFVISMGLIIGALVTFNQASFLMEKDMGLDYNSTLIIRAPMPQESFKERNNKLGIIENKVKEIPAISSYTFFSDAPGDQVTHFINCRKKGQASSHNKWYDRINVDSKFKDFFNIKLLAGRSFHIDETKDQHTILINNLSAKRLGYNKPDDAINQMVLDNRNIEFKIIGVVDDFHYISVKTATKPFVLSMNDKSRRFLALRIDENAQANITDVIPKLEQIFKSIYPEQPFDYFLLDEKMQMFLKPEFNFVGIFTAFSILAVIVAIIGIIGLILININQNMRELGVRKALGAELADVSKLLSKQLITQFIIALAITVPLTYYGYEHVFLQNYIHRIELQYWYFILPVILMTIVIFSVIAIISKRVLKIKTCEVLKYE